MDFLSVANPFQESQSIAEIRLLPCHLACAFEHRPAFESGDPPGPSIGDSGCQKFVPSLEMLQKLQSEKLWAEFSFPTYCFTGTYASSIRYIHTIGAKLLDYEAIGFRINFRQEKGTQT